MFKAFLVIFSYVTSYEFKNLVGWRDLNWRTQNIVNHIFRLNKT